MPDRQIFFDPQRKRWKRLRRILDISAVTITVVVAIFIFNVLRQQHLPELLLPSPKHNYKAISDRQSDLMRAEKAKEKPARRKTNRKASDIPFNTGEGIRGAYYRPDDAASYSTFKEHVHQIDIVFPMWLHVSQPDGNLMGESSDDTREYRLVDNHGVHDPDDLNKIKNVIQRPRKIPKSSPT